MKNFSLFNFLFNTAILALFIKNLDFCIKLCINTMDFSQYWEILYSKINEMKKCKYHDNEKY